MGFNFGAFAGGMADAYTKQQELQDRKRLTDIQVQNAEMQKKLFEQQQNDQAGLQAAAQETLGLPTSTATNGTQPANAVDSNTPSALPVQGQPTPAANTQPSQTPAINPGTPAPVPAPAAIPSAPAPAPAAIPSASAPAPAPAAIPSAPISVPAPAPQAQQPAVPPQQGAIPPAQPPAVSASQMADNFYKSAIAHGVNPTLALKTAGELQQQALGKLQLSEAEKQAQINDAFQKESKEHFKRLELFSKTDPTSAESVASVLGPEYEMHNPGHKVGFDKKTNTVTFVGDDGKPHALKPGEAFALAKQMSDDHFANLSLKYAKDPTSFLDAYNKLQTLRETHEKNQNEAKYQGVMGAAATTSADAAMITAKAHAGVYNQMVETAKTNEAARTAMEPALKEFADLSKDEQMGKAGEAALLKAATAGAKVSKDIAPLLAVIRKPERTISPEREKSAYAELQNARGDKARENAVKADYPDVFGENPLVTKLKEAVANQNKETQKVETTTAPKGVPVEQKFIREKNSRGAYTYTPSPRGMTKAEWSKLDESKQAIPAQ
jgi:hypothetical protein